MIPSPIFVVGPSRSGTTLTTDILGRHSQISTRGTIGLLRRIDAVRTKIGGATTGAAAAREAVLSQVRAYYTEFQDASAQAAMESLICNTGIASEVLAAPSHTEMSRIFLDGEAMYAGKSRWARHSTGGVYYLTGLFSGFPDAKVILCAREPLDCLVSYRDSFKRAARRNRTHEVERLRRLYHPVVTSLLWVASMRAAKRALERYPDRVLLSRYEDLVADPEASVRRICAFIGSDFEPGMLAIERNNSSDTVCARGIFATSVGRWRQSLAAADAFIAQKICAREMRRLGYSPVAIRPNMWEVARQVLSAPLFAFRALSANRRRRKSKLPDITRRIAAFVRG